MIDWNSSGRLFHSFWPLKVNARWPAAVLQSGICRRSLFLVLQLCTSDLILNFWQRYGGASPFKHLNTMVASLTSSCLMIGSHCNYLRIGVTWSNFLVPESIRAAKFCTVCNSSMFFLVVLAHTDEQYNNLLKTRESIMVMNLRLSNRYFTRFINYLRNRKHVPCFYRVIQTRVEVWENEKCCGNTSRRRVFPQLFRVLPNFHECLYNSIETRYMFSISFRKHQDEKKENNLLTLIIKM